MDAWKDRNDQATIRAKVFKRDKGVCAICGLDCVAAQRLACDADSRLNWTERQEFGHLVLPPGFRASFPRWHSRDWWDADHIVPVVRGGGQCGLDGYRTLCCPCHKRETAKLARDRAEERLAEKRRRDPQLELIAGQ